MVGMKTTLSPSAVASSGTTDTTIVRAAIYPGIGVARIGNSTEPDGYYIGPEVTVPPVTTTGETRDSQGAIKRQAARFRIYGYNAAGQVVGEIGPDTAEIQWQAHLVNRKAQWYQFQAALDIPDAVNMTVPLRNPKVKGADREGLAIDPGPRTIAGCNTQGPAYQFDTGTFQNVPVPLGELRTDADGNLLVLGGLGVSASPTGKPVFIPADPNSFNNADGWYDDTSDGPVRATVVINGTEIPVDSAWVIVAPPNFAPDVIGWRTLYDLLMDTYIEAGWLPYPAQPSFTRDILPALQRLSGLQWVNKGFAAFFGIGGALNFEDPALLAKLSFKPQPGAADPYAELRQTIFNAFRPATNTVNDPRTWPWVYGDAYGSFSDASPLNNLPLSAVRTRNLQLWAEGEFLADWDPACEPPHTLDEVPLAEQPAMLDQAALHFCLSDAFHPGCELTWPMRHATLYRAPFRIRERAASTPEPAYGSKLDQAKALMPGGPLYDQAPGDLSRWMALPWQGDTAFCRSGYDPEYDPYLPTFWPARVPNQVLTAEDYLVAVNPNLPREERIAAFNNRAQWLRKLTGTTVDQMMQMVAGFGTMGIVEARKGVEGDPDLPSVMLVESLPPKQAAVTFAAAGAALESAALTPAAARAAERLRAAGWESTEQLEEARRAIGWK